MMMHDARTGFELGDPQVIPLSEASRLPSMAELQKEFSSMILSASGWRKVFAVSGEEEDATEEIGAANGVIAALIAQVFADYIIRRRGPACRNRPLDFSKRSGDGLISSRPFTFNSPVLY